MTQEKTNMAALVKREYLFRAIKIALNCGSTATYSAKPPKKSPPTKKPGPKIYSTAQSLEAKGYLRPQKPYNPPEDVENQLKSVFSSVLGANAQSDTPLSDPNTRFHVLNACYKTFDHTVPNSLLHTIQSIGDVIEFYQTPVSTVTPIDRYQYMDLPPNLHIQQNPHRFNPETDEKFGGISAFPKSGTLVTGLKTRKMYKTTEPQNWDPKEESLGYTPW